MQQKPTNDLPFEVRCVTHRIHNASVVRTSRRFATEQEAKDYAAHRNASEQYPTRRTFGVIDVRRFA